MINALISAVLQVGLVLLVAAGIWLAAGRREPFLHFVGLTPAPWKVVALASIAALIVTLAVTRLPAVQTLATGQGTVVGEAMGSAARGELAAILAIRALLQTGLSEELVFRGLIGRNLIRRWGFAAGNGVQATLFGLLHLLLLLSPAATLAAVMAWIAATAAAGWMLGWVNHRYAAGSILPGWVMHGGGNLTAYLILIWGI